MLSRPWEIFEWAGEQIDRDYVDLDKKLDKSSLTRSLYLYWSNRSVIYRGGSRSA